MLVTMIDTVEDANEFTIAELGDAPRTLPYTLRVTDIKVGGTVVGLHRVDKIPAKAVVDLPTKQGEHLVALGLASLT